MAGTLELLAYDFFRILRAPLQTLSDFEPKEMQKPGLKPGFLHFDDSVTGPAVRLLVQADQPRFEGVFLPGRSPEDRRLAAVYGRPSTRSG